MSKNNKNINPEEKSYFLLTAIIIGILIIAMWVATYFYLIDNENKGVIGDMFGSINALFSGLALAGIILTILLQRNELKLQREELKQTRQEFETQNETLRLQRFENTFFNILNLHHEIVANMELLITTKTTQGTSKTEKQTIYKGRKVFDKQYGFFLQNLKDNESKFEEVYNKIYDYSNSHFGHYFRNLYQIIKLVDQTDFADNQIKNFNEKYKYTSIIRAQLSDSEMSMLFYNCLHKNGKLKFKPLLEKYTFFNNINDNLVFESHKKLYVKNAFERDNDQNNY